MDMEWNSLLEINTGEKESVCLTQPGKSGISVEQRNAEALRPHPPTLDGFKGQWAKDNGFLPQ